MIDIIPVLLKDFYKAGHVFQYPPLVTMVYSNFTPRGSRVPGVEKIMSFGWQGFIREFLVNQFKDNFFQIERKEVLRLYKRRMETSIGPLQSYRHIEQLHEVGYLPIQLKTIPEGMRVPLRVPLATIRNTEKDFGWLTNMLETLISAEMWMPITSATTAFQYRLTFEDFARLTTGQKFHPMVQWQGHDFSMRGMGSVWDAMRSGAAHLLSFTGTDTIPAIDYLEDYYLANAEKELIGASIPATEHSVMCVDGEAGEYHTIHRLLTEVYPKGMLSVVMDTWDFWHVINVILPRLKDIIMRREGKLVVRPDSGDPVKILIGDLQAQTAWERKGLVECLFDTFGGQMNKAGYRELDSHIGCIYGDSITQDRQQAILEGLARKKFASTNVVFGIGSYTYQYVTRDTYGTAIKATYAEVEGRGRAIQKAPKTDSGIKNSARGLLRVNDDGTLKQDANWQEEAEGLLQSSFYNGHLDHITTLGAIRARVMAEVEREFISR